MKIKQVLIPLGDEKTVSGAMTVPYGSAMRTCRGSFLLMGPETI